MSSPDTHTQIGRALSARLVRYVSLAVVAASLAGLAISSLGQSDAQAASGDSSINVEWTDSAAAGVAQPVRDINSPHFADFDDLSVKVSQTSDLNDQAIRVSFTGFAGGSRAMTDGGNKTWQTATNFMQAMQCWGDPTDVDFRTTCQWGGRYGPNNGLGNAVYDDNQYRVSGEDLGVPAAGAIDPPDVPFVTAGGQIISGRLQAGSGGSEVYPLFSITGPSTTNEVTAARARSDGSGYFDFETQTADQAPQLGCGREGHLTCYLVLVPRGSHFGGEELSKCSRVLGSAPARDRYYYGRPDSIQAGSPLNPACDYWHNRIVIPLTFNQVGVTCPIGAAEQRVTGSQLLVGAMASWQPQLCTTAGATFSFATNPDGIARLQLLDEQTDVAFASRPILKSELDDETAEFQLDRTALSYAPVAVAGVAIAYYAEGPSGRIDDLRLTPRLAAKLLTQSYRFQVPFTTTAAQDNIAHLPEVNRSYSYWAYDPDVQAANPNWEAFTENPAIVLPGPSGADAIRQLWAWVLSDAEARNWLRGEKDPWGMTVNPYYLPFGHANAEVPVFDEQGLPVLDGDGVQETKPVGLRNTDGSAMSLAEAQIDYFLKADETQVPFQLTIESRRFDSLQAFPYTETFITGARDAFRADPHSKVSWDPSKATDAGSGDWVSTGPQLLGRRFMIAVTDVASARRYALDTADLRLASGAWTVADDASMTAALSAVQPIGGTALVQVDPAQVTGTAYPLTSVVYAITNLSGSTPDALDRVADFLRFAAGDGQTPGVQIGNLPPGYVPLSPQLATQSKAAAEAIDAFTAFTLTPAPTTTTSSSAESSSLDDLTPGASDPEIIPGEPHAQVMTPTVASTPISSALGLLLFIGLSGALFAPWLLRGARWLR